MERSLIWYRRHQVAAGSLVWLPTIFLYLIGRFGIGTALQLQAVYYLAVVVIEVPSGWFSDRVGRVVTLRTVAICWIVAHGLLASGAGLWAIVIAQVLLAAGYALISGTDVTLHFELLESIGRADQYSSREAEVRRLSLVAAGCSAAVGGGLGMIDLRLPFVVALVIAVAQFGCAARLSEPTAVDRGHRGAGGGGLLADLASLRARYREPILAWVTLAVLAQVVVVHLAAELGAPYLTAVLDADPGSPAAPTTQTAPLANGLLAAAVSIVAAVGVNLLGPVVRRVGLRVTLIAVAFVPVAILGAMSATTSLALAPLLVLRGLPGAANAVIVPAIVGGRVPSNQRATFLSVASLSGRLSYAGVLGGLSSLAVDDGVALRVGAVVGLGLWLAMAVSSRLVRDFPTGTDHEHHHDHEAVTHDHFHTHDDGHHDHDHDHNDDHDHGGHPVATGGHRHSHHHEPTRHHHAHSRDLHHDHIHE